MVGVLECWSDGWSDSWSGVVLFMLFNSSEPPLTGFRINCRLHANYICHCSACPVCLSAPKMKINIPSNIKNRLVDPFSK